MFSRLTSYVHAETTPISSQQVAQTATRSITGEIYEGFQCGEFQRADVVREQNVVLDLIASQDSFIQSLNVVLLTKLKQKTMTILITGATGNIGGEVIKHLVKKKLPLRALVRDRHKASKLEAQGVELAQGDFSLPDTLDAALLGVEKAFLVMPNAPHQVELESNFIDAAQRSGVRHVVKLSVMGAGELPSTFQKWHRQIEEHLEASGITWTHLRPNMLMQNMRWFAQTIAQSGSIYNSVGDTKISHVDARDVAAIAAACLSEPGHENKSYVLTGSQAITFDEIAGIFAKELKRSVAYVDLPPADLKAARLANGEPEWYLDAELELFACWKQGAGTAVNSAIADLTRRPATTYEEFAQDYAQAHAQDFAARS